MPRITQQLKVHTHPGERPKLCVRIPVGAFEQLGFVDGAEVEIYPAPNGAIVVRPIRRAPEHDTTNPTHVARCPKCMRDFAMGRGASHHRPTLDDSHRPR